MSIPKVLTIAGSDSGAGAGIQADLKTYAALGVYGTSAITAITAQNTLGVQHIHILSKKVVKQQIDAVMNDIKPTVWKTGMLGNIKIVSLVANLAQKYTIRQLIVDPVMLAKNGNRLLAKNALDVFIKKLISKSFVITPNCNEAEALTKVKIKTLNNVKKAAVIIKNMGPCYVVIKGGHLSNNTYALDLLYDGKDFVEFKTRRIKTKNLHGTGCTFASAIAAELAKGNDIKTAVKNAKAYITKAIYASVDFTIGNGLGPLNHLV